MKVLFVGESWTVVTTHIKGADQFSQSYYEEGTKWIRRALESGGIEFVHMPCHAAMWDFPSSADELKQYDAVLFSDVGYNSIMLHPDTLRYCKKNPNRLEALKEYVRQGGAFAMIGGYMSFSGIEGKAHYKGSPVEDILPVWLQEGDDRVESTQGISPECRGKHPIMEGIEDEFPYFLSYNRIIPKTEATVVLPLGDDPLLVVWEYGNGRTAAFAADTAPHGAPPAFLEWGYFDRFWTQILKWLCRQA